jgi:hypothetical protein
LSVNAIDLQHPKVDLTASGVTVEGVQRETGAVYKVTLEFYEDIDVKVPPSPSLCFVLFALFLVVVVMAVCYLGSDVNG